LFKRFGKIVGIAAVIPIRLITKSASRRCSRQFKFKDLDKIDKTVGSLRALVKLFDI